MKQTILTMFEKFFNFLYALFFTRDDDLDVLQLLFTAIVVTTLLVVWKRSNVLGVSDAVQIEGLITLRWLAGLLVVTAVPKWLVPTIASMFGGQVQNSQEGIDKKDTP